MMTHRTQRGLTALSTLALAVSGCSGPTTERAPQVPPISTLAVNFADFTVARDMQGAGFSNYEWAAGHVAVWNVILTVTLIVPVAAFGESFNHDAVQKEDGSWSWIYDSVVQNRTYSAELNALASGGDIQWTMTISQENGWQDVVWFTGKSNLPATAGTWTLNRDPNDPREFLFIEWERDANDETGEVRYTNVEEGAAANGGYIHYGFTLDTPYNAFYDIFNAENKNNIRIEANLETQAGRVRDENFFGDADWHCWDTELAGDPECPAGS